VGRRGYKPLRRQRASAEIHKLIEKQDLWGRRLPGERELAAQLGVSRGTLQKALELLEARGVVRRRHGCGTFAAERDGPERRGSWTESRLCLLSPAAHLEPRGKWGYYSDMVSGVERGARRADLDLTKLRLEDYWQQGPTSNWSKLRQFDAFVVVERDDLALVSCLLKLRRPVAILDSYFRDLPVIGVVDGSFEGARRAVGYLLRQGHRRVGYIPPGETAEAPHEKSQGYRAALGEAGIAFDPKLIVSPGYRNVESGVRKAVRKFLGMEEPPTAIFAGTDHRAVVALEELERRGLRVGEDIALLGFGDSAFRSGQCDRLSSARIYTRQMGEAAVRALLEVREAPEVRTVVVPDRLIVRQSTCQPPVSLRRA
jgi:DNA-binding LacI/PurR family transcriptional regulator